mmetsp:Transcript_49702/g.153566  ORF Transcript_49702/g.153566 Transcript_49702/m.153566 type:complete len:399 (+) Transcript_49702:1038-2234(+)
MNVVGVVGDGAVHILPRHCGEKFSKCSDDQRRRFRRRRTRGRGHVLFDGEGRGLGSARGQMNPKERGGLRRRVREIADDDGEDLPTLHDERRECRGSRQHRRRSREGGRESHGLDGVTRRNPRVGDERDGSRAKVAEGVSVHRGGRQGDLVAGGFDVHPLGRQGNVGGAAAHRSRCHADRWLPCRHSGDRCRDCPQVRERVARDAHAAVLVSERHSLFLRRVRALRDGPRGGGRVHEQRAERLLGAGLGCEPLRVRLAPTAQALRGETRLLRDQLFNVEAQQRAVRLVARAHAARVRPRVLDSAEGHDAPNRAERGRESILHVVQHAAGAGRVELRRELRLGSHDTQEAHHAGDEVRRGSHVQSIAAFTGALLEPHHARAEGWVPHRHSHHRRHLARR